MPKLEKTPYEGWFYLSLHELVASLGVSESLIIEIVDQGIVHVGKNEQDEWLFDSEALVCVRTVLQLNRDLGVNIAGAGVVLDLLKEIDRLHALLAARH